MDFFLWIIGFICPTAFGLALWLITPPINKYSEARACFWISAVLLWIVTMAWTYYNIAFWPRAVISSIVAAVATFLLTYMLHLTAERQKAETAPKPAPAVSQHPPAIASSNSQPLLDQLGFVPRDFASIAPDAHKVGQIANRMREEYARENGGKLIPDHVVNEELQREGLKFIYARGVSEDSYSISPIVEKAARPVKASHATPSKVSPSSAEASPASGESVESKMAFLRELTNLYIHRHDGISSEMMAGLELPPEDWLNEQLEKQGKAWRVRNVKGASVEFYDGPPAASK